MSVKTNIKDFYGRVIGTVVEENNGDKTIKGLMAEVAKAAGCTLDVVRFARFERGEGIEKRQDNLAEEIAQMTKA